MAVETRNSLFGQAMKRIRLHSLDLMNGLLHPLDCALAKHYRQTNEFQPLLFIIGPPRCGSTLLYQVLVECFDVAYLSNAHASLYGMPTLIEKWMPSTWRSKASYRSNLGNTRGLTAPSEAGRFWYRFFDRGETTGSLPEPIRAKLRDAVRYFSRTAGKPVVFKNLFSTVRLLELGRLFPEAVFLEVHRNEVEIGHSLLEARMTRFGSYEPWFSVPAPNQHLLEKRPPHQQVIEQVRSLYALVDRQREELGTSRFFRIDYEAFCDAPVQSLQRIEQFALSRGVCLQQTNPIPHQFERRQSVRIDPDLYQRMTDYAHALQRV